MTKTNLPANFVGRATRGLSNSLFLSALALLFFAAAPAAMAWTMVSEANSFNTGAGNWLITQNNTANGNNVDWLNSNLAGGTAGELGGTVVRHDTTAFYGRLLDFSVTLNDQLRWSGVFSCTNTFLNWNNSVYIGYFNTTAALGNTVTSDYVAWRVREPNTGPTTLGGYRTRAQINIGGLTVPSSQQSSPNGAYGQGTSYSFDVQWTPSGLNDGAGMYSGTIGPYAFAQAIGPQANAGSFDAFGIFWDESAIDTTVRFNGYFDSLEYLVPTIPEPSAGMLLALGVAALLSRNRLARARSAQRN